MQNHLVVFKKKNIRRVIHNNEWWFSVADIVEVLTETTDVRQYIKKMRQRDPQLDSNWGTICTPVELLAPDGKKRETNCANTEGIFRIIQSIPSPKAEPFKLWLAKVGYERVQEIADPEQALNRSRGYWQKMGRSQQWIQQRMMGQEIRNKLTDYWQNNEVKEKEEYAILTDIIHKEWTDLTTKEHKQYKGLKTENLRDHMTDAELVFTALAELTTRQIAEADRAQGLDENKIPARKGGKIAKNARLELEEKTGQNVVSRKNFKRINNNRNKAIDS